MFDGTVVSTGPSPSTTLYVAEVTFANAKPTAEACEASRSPQATSRMPACRTSRSEKTGFSRRFFVTSRATPPTHVTVTSDTHAMSLTSLRRMRVRVAVSFGSGILSPTRLPETSLFASRASESFAARSLTAFCDSKSFAEAAARRSMRYVWGAVSVISSAKAARLQLTSTPVATP